MTNRSTISLGVLVLVGFAFIGALVFRSDPEPVALAAESGSVATTTTLADAPPDLGLPPEVKDLDGWLNTDATDYSDFDGQIRVIQFWTFGCYNCKNTLPHLQALYDEYQPQGVEIIGFHAPEFEFEADPANVESALPELGVTWPVALDTGKTNFRSWQTGGRFWPRTFVLDKDGHIRFDHVGEGAYDDLFATVDWLVNNDT